MAFEELINGEPRLDHRIKLNNNFGKAVEKEANKSLVLNTLIQKLQDLPDPSGIAQMIATAITQTKSEILGGAAGAYDTLLEIENLLKAEDTEDLTTKTAILEAIGLKLSQDSFNTFVTSNTANIAKKQDSLGWMNVKKAFGAKEDGVYLYDAAISGAVVTSARAQFSQADVSKVFCIKMAGLGGIDFTSTILSVQSPTQCTLTSSALINKTNQLAIYGTDDTVAIQAAIDAAKILKCVVPYLPYENNGIYVINGALNRDAANSYPNSQLYVPVCGDVFDNLKMEVIPTILLKGAVKSAPNIAYSSTGATRPIPQTGVTLHSTLTSGSAYTDIGVGVNTLNFTDVIPPSVIGGRNRAYGYYTRHTRMALDIEDININVCSNNGSGGPVLTGINARQIGCLGVRGTRITSDVTGKDSIEPINEVSGIIFPDYSTDNQRVNESIYIGGFKYGIQYGEHGDYSNIWTLSCVYGHVFTKSLHPILLRKVSAQYCKYPVAFASDNLLPSRKGQVSFEIENLQLEQRIDTADWRKTVVTILDENSQGYGIIRGQAYNISVNPAVIVAMSKTGGDNLRIQNMSMFKYASNAAAKAAGLVAGSEYITPQGEHKTVIDIAAIVYSQNFDGTAGTGATTLTPQTGSGNLVMFTGDSDWTRDGSGAATSAHASLNRISVGSQPADNIRVIWELAVTLSGVQSFTGYLGRSSHDASTAHNIACGLIMNGANYQLQAIQTISAVNSGGTTLSTAVAAFANPKIIATLTGTTLLLSLYNGATLVTSVTKTLTQANVNQIHGWATNFVGAKINNFQIESL